MHIQRLANAWNTYLNTRTEPMQRDGVPRHRVTERKWDKLQGYVHKVTERKVSREDTKEGVHKWSRKVQ
jgi:hypothetical protein